MFIPYYYIYGGYNVTIAEDMLKLINGTIVEKINIIVANTEKQLLNKLYLDTINIIDTETVYTIPSNLEYIVTEVSMIRLGRIGSEGLKSESISGSNVSYILPKEDFDAYKQDITAFIARNDNFSTEGSLVFYWDMIQIYHL